MVSFISIAPFGAHEASMRTVKHTVKWISQNFSLKIYARVGKAIEIIL